MAYHVCHMAINYRKARAGEIIYHDPGVSQASALIAAGYTANTARTPASKGVGALACVREAQAADLIPSSGNLVESARQVLQKKLDQYRNSEKDLHKARASEIARIVEITEKYHGDTLPPSEGKLARWADRLEQVSLALAELKARKAGSVDNLESLHLPQPENGANPDNQELARVDKPDNHDNQELEPHT